MLLVARVHALAATNLTLAVTATAWHVLFAVGGIRAMNV
jgi:hypothetical protein